MADVLAVRDEYRAQTWAMLIQESKTSGLTNKKFCEQRGVSEKSFYYWQRKLRSHIIESSEPQLVPLDRTVISGDALDIRFRGAELKLPAGVDIDAVAALLRSLQTL